MKERVLCLPLTSTQPVFQLTRSSFRWQLDVAFSEPYKYYICKLFVTTLTISLQYNKNNCLVERGTALLGVGMGKQVGLPEGGIFIKYYRIYIIIYSFARCIHIFEKCTHPTLMILLIAGGPLSLKDWVQQALETRVRSTRGKEKIKLI